MHSAFSSKHVQMQLTDGTGVFSSRAESRGRRFVADSLPWSEWDSNFRSRTRRATFRGSFSLVMGAQSDWCEHARIVAFPADTEEPAEVWRLNCRARGPRNESHCRCC